MMKAPLHILSGILVILCLASCGGSGGKVKSDSQVLQEEFRAMQASLPAALEGGVSMTAIGYDADGNLVSCEYLVPGMKPLSEDEKRIQHQVFCGGITGFFDECQKELFTRLRPDIRIVIRSEEGAVVYDDTLLPEEYLR